MVQSKGISEKDDEKQRDLVREIKNISLLQGTLQNLLEADSEDSILRVIQEGLNILFDVKRILFFLYDPERDILVGKSTTPDKQNGVLSEVAIPFQKGKSLLINSLIQGSPLDSFDVSLSASLTIIDEQIIRLIGKDGILCLPLIAHKNRVGVIALGLDKPQISHLSHQLKLLTLFAKQAALSVYANSLKKSQRKLVQYERLTSSSTIARKVVHEVNTPLSIIKNYLSVLKQKLAEGEPVQEEIMIVNEETDRVAHIVSELSSFSEPDIQKKDSFDLNALLSKLISVLQESQIMGPDINVHFTLDPFLPFVHTDKNSLKQVFTNLVKNAVEAMPGGGNLHISTRYAPNDLEIKMAPDSRIDPGYVDITLRDDGPGIPDTLKPRIFEPYVTSKGTGHTGLGLSIVYNTIKDLKGTITCKSNNTEGTSFKIVLPAAKNPK